MLVVEQIHEIWNFKRFLEPLGVVFSGLVPTPGEPSACHSWRFVTRVELFRARGSDDFSIDQGMLIDGDQCRMAHDLDVVLLVKQWVPAPIEAHTPWPSPPRCTLGGGRCIRVLRVPTRSIPGFILYPGPVPAPRAPP